MPDVLATLGKLPPHCFTTLGTQPELVIRLDRGVSGYFPVAEEADSAGAKARADALNAALPAPPTPAQILAMELGSCFGWEVPGADPDHWHSPRYMVEFVDDACRPADCHPDFFTTIEAARAAGDAMLPELAWAKGFNIVRCEGSR